MFQASRFHPEEVVGVPINKVSPFVLVERAVADFRGHTFVEPESSEFPAHVVYVCVLDHRGAFIDKESILSD